MFGFVKGNYQWMSYKNNGMIYVICNNRMDACVFPKG